MAPWQTASYITRCNSTAFFGDLTFGQAKILFLKTSRVISLIKYTYHENIVVSRFLDVMQQLENPTLLLFGEKRCFNVFDNSVHLIFQFGSVQSLSHVHSLRPHGLQHARPPYPSPTPRVYSDLSIDSYPFIPHEIPVCVCSEKTQAVVCTAGITEPSAQHSNV